MQNVHERRAVTRELPFDVRRYLSGVRARGPQDPHGIYISRDTNAGQSQESWFVLGVIALAMVAWPLQHLVDTSHVIDRVGDTDLLLFCVGSVLVRVSVMEWRALRESADLGAFEYFGPKSWWVVDRNTVREIRLEPVSNVQGQQEFRNGVYTRSWVSFGTPSGYRRLTFTDRTLAAHLTSYLQSLEAMSKHNVPYELRGRMAMHAARTGTLSMLEHRDKVGLFPELPARVAGNTLARGLSAAGALLGAYLIVNYLYTDAWASLNESRLYEAAMHEGNLEAARRHTALFPSHAHAAEVHSAIAQITFDRAKAVLTSTRSPLALADLLASMPEHPRAAEARKLIQQQLQSALDGLRASARTSEASPRLLAIADHLLATALARKDTNVSLVVNTDLQLEPTNYNENVHELDAVTRIAAGLVKDGDWPEEKELKVIVIEPGFDEQRIAAAKSRTRVTLEREFAQLMGGQQLRLVLSEGGAVPDVMPALYVHYEVRPTGELIVYERQDAKGKDEIAGLLRDLAVQVTLRTNPADSKRRELTFSNRSTPLRHIELAPDVKAPRWAPYALVMEAAIDDVAQQFRAADSPAPTDKPRIYTYRKL